MSSHILINASGDIQQLRDGNAKINEIWIFAKITKQFSFLNLHNHSKRFIANDKQQMLKKPTIWHFTDNSYKLVIQWYTEI